MGTIQGTNIYAEITNFTSDCPNSLRVLRHNKIHFLPFTQELPSTSEQAESRSHLTIQVQDQTLYVKLSEIEKKIEDGKSFIQAVDRGQRRCDMSSRLAPWAEASNISNEEKKERERIKEQITAYFVDQTQAALFDLRKVSTPPPGIESLQNLKNIRVISEEPEKILSQLEKLKSLENLTLFSTKINTYPQGLEKIPSLTSLNLNSIQLDSLPPSIGKLKNLTYLILFNNQLTALPKEIHSLSRLKELNLSYNKIKRLPDGIERLNQLSALLLDNNELETIPKEISTLQKLERLELSYNPFTKLPAEILTLPPKTAVTIRGHQLSQKNLLDLDVQIEQRKQENLQIPQITLGSSARKPPAERIVELPLATLLKIASVDKILDFLSRESKTSKRTESLLGVLFEDDKKRIDEEKKAMVDQEKTPEEVQAFEREEYKKLIESLNFS